MQDFLTDISSLIVFLFAKQTNRLFSCFLEISENGNLKWQNTCEEANSFSVNLLASCVCTPFTKI